MSFTSALRKNQVAVTTTLTAYQNKVTSMCVYITGVTGTKLPTLSVYPPDWQEYSDAYINASGAALGWTNSVMGKLLSTPQSVTGYNKNITALLQSASSQATILLGNPNDIGAKDLLQQNLDDLTQTLSMLEVFISSAVTSITDFNNTLPDQANTLKTISANAVQDGKAKAYEITVLQGEIDSLNALIDTKSKEIIGLGVALGVSVVMGVLTVPFGPVAWLVFGSAIAVEATYIALNTQAIKDAKAAIEATVTKMDTVTQDCAALTTTAQSFSTLADEATKMESIAQAVLEAWQTLADDLNAASTAISQAIIDEGTPDWSDVAADLATATTEWQTTYSQASGLVLPTKGSNAQISVGMTEAEVQTAVDTSPSMSFVLWANQF